MRQLTAMRNGTFLMLGLIAGCCNCASKGAPDDYRPAIPAKAPDTLRILAWNIWMMPPITLQSPKNEPRARHRKGNTQVRLRRSLL
jgi:hypothetical protein